MQKHFKKLIFLNYQFLQQRKVLNSITNNLEKLKIGKIFLTSYQNFIMKKMKKTGIAGIFAASLELVKDGAVHISTKKLFKEVMIKKKS